VTHTTGSLLSASQASSTSCDPHHAVTRAAAPSERASFKWVRPAALATARQYRDRALAFWLANQCQPTQASA